MDYRDFKGQMLGTTSTGTLKKVLVDDEGNIYTKLTGKLMQDADLIKQALDNIQAMVGLNKIRALLPMWEAVAATKVYDLLNRSLTFTPTAVTFGEDGPFGDCANFPGTTSKLVQDALTENTTGTVAYNIDGATEKAATKIIKIAGKVGFVRMRVKRVGTLNTATVRAAIYTDNSGVPGAAVTNGTSIEHPCANIGTSNEFRGFAFTTPPSLQKDRNYWLVLEYVNATGVDGSNYIVWTHDNAAGTYAQGRATYDGATWTAVATASHTFSVFSDDFVFAEDFSIIALAENTDSVAANRYLCGWPGMTDALVAGIKLSSSGFLTFNGFDSTLKSAVGYKYPTGFDVYAMTFSKAKDTAKINGYLNNKLVGSVNGDAGTANKVFAQPFHIGAISANNGNATGFWQGRIGCVLVVDTELTASQIADIAAEMTILRKYGLAL